MRGEEMTKVSLAVKLILGDGGDVTRRCSTVSGNFSEWRCTGRSLILLPVAMATESDASIRMASMKASIGRPAMHVARRLSDEMLPQPFSESLTLLPRIFIKLMLRPFPHLHLQSSFCLPQHLQSLIQRLNRRVRGP